MVVIQKPQIIEPGKVPVEAFSVAFFSVTYGAQPKETDDFTFPIENSMASFSNQGKCLS